ncbi:YfjI family protein [Methylobacterium sp. J-076]|uniref:YfjI family protein n=1 Tax=Methylobacterium sp. J-076 TaxID=2836655 RepID=UPI0024442273|nr:YfjI family protein [Methylobacterium sp. J-076]
MRDAVEALEHHVQAPRSLCAHSILSAAMLCCQGLADVRIEGLPAPRPLSLFMLAVAVSGERKSACDDLALMSVARAEAQLRAEHVEELREYKATHAAFEAEKKKIERDNKLSHEERRQRLRALREPDVPLAPVIRAKEPNLEGLLNLLQIGRGSVGIFTSEGGQFLGGHGMTQEAKTRTVTGLSELWDSGSAQRVRARETLFLNGCRVGISLAAQPRVASALLGDELAKDQGFVGRFLITMPDSRIGLRQIRGTNPLTDMRLTDFHDLCRQCLNAGLPLREGSRNQLEPPVLDLDPDAAILWRQFAQSVEDGCAPGGPWVPVRSAALKMAENVARIAAVSTVFQAPSITWPSRIARADRVLEATVPAETMAAAIAVGTFYLQEALRLTGHAILDPETRAQNELAEWVAEKHSPGDLTAPSILQKMAPSHLRTDAATLRRRVEALVGFGRLEPAGRQEIGGKAYRETFRVLGEAA